MKKLLILILLINLSFAEDRTYWTDYKITVKTNMDDLFLKKIDKILNDCNDVNKAFLSNLHFSEKFENGENLYLTFTGSEPSDVYGGNCGSSMDWNEISKITIWNSGSMGYSLMNFGDQNYEGKFGMEYHINVKDPQTYATAFSKMMNDTKDISPEKFNAELGMYLMGRKSGISHYIWMEFETFDEMVKTTEKIFASKAFLEFNKTVSPIRELISTEMRKINKRWQGN